MPRKENTKAKTWERDRRKRMNAYFKTLADLLPPHQEGRKRNKVDILIHASKYIKDLHSRTEDLFSAHASEAHKEELTRLKKLVTQLFSRTQLLSTLLRDAGISVPAEPALEKISPLKWSNKINVEDAEKYFSKIEELKNSESKKEKAVEHKVPSKRKSAVAASNSSSKKSVENSDRSKDVNSSIENQENQVNCANSKDENSDVINSATEAGSKEAENCQTSTSSDVAVSCPVNGKTNNALQKVESQKKVKKKPKKKDEKKSLTPCINNSMTSLTPNTLILSGGKLMPLVTPITSNIIVNTQQQPANPIILGSAQQNQMIVMQPLTNSVQNPVVSICNQAVINTVQKVTLNTVPSIRANMVVDSRNWASNVKNIINATKIGGHKGILPKGKEVTKTTMTYKVPIPAVHKEKVEKSKEHSSKKDTEVKSKISKNQVKSAKSQQSTEIAEEKNQKEKNVKSAEDTSGTHKVTIKRPASSEIEITDAPIDKKRKTNETNEESTANVQSATLSKSDFAVTCKSIESLKHVIEKIGEDMNDEQNKNQPVTQTEEKGTETNIECPTLLCTTDVSQENVPDSSKSGIILTSNIIQEEVKGARDQASPATFCNEHVESSNENVSSETDFNIPVNSSLEKSSDNVDSPNSKSSLTEVEEAVAESAAVSKKMKEVCNLGTEFGNLLQVAQKDPEVATASIDNNKIILNLDTNTTTTLKPETSNLGQTSDSATTSTSLLPVSIVDESKLTKTSKDEVSKTSLSYNTENSFVPINNRTDGLHSDLSNDIFASLQVPSSSHNPESISPTAAFLMAFPLVSSLNGKTEVLEEEMKQDFKYHSQTPPMLLQIGTMEPNSFRLKAASPSHSLDEKRLKVTCEEKKNLNPSVSETVNSDMVVSVECSTTTKSLPKVVNDESLREPYKLVPNILTPTLEKSVTSAPFAHATLYSIANVSSTTSITSTSGMVDNCQNQLATSLRNVITNSSGENVTASQNNTASISNKTDQNNCPVQVSACDTNVRYGTSQDFLSSYSTIVENNLTSLQQNSTTSTSSAIPETNSVGLNQNVVPEVSQSQLLSHLTNASTTTNTSSLPLQSMQMDSNIVSNNRLNYTGHIDRVHQTSSQNIQQEYTMQSKDTTIPIHPSQAMQSVYEAQPKDSHVLSTQQNGHQNYSVHEKDHIIQNAHNDYTVDQNKNLPRKDSYSAGNNNGTASNRNQGYSSKDQIPNSSENHFQRSYPKLNKVSDSSGNNIIDQDAKLNDVLRSKAQEVQDHRRDANYSSTKKMDVDPFVQTFSYGVKEPMNTPGDQNVLHQNADNMFQGKREETPNYSNYTNKDGKKINTSSSNNMSSKSLIQNTAVTRYSQQSTSFVATSNYEQSTVTENHAKSTTTVAHNSSNFSILSWTTFSPVGGGSSNNNLVQFEQGSNLTDNTEAKTICENYNYVPLHKENPNYPNVLTNDVYSVNSTMANIDKSRMKSTMEQQKQSFVDPSKSRNIQTNVPPSGKQNRMQNQSQTSSSNNDYTKFNAENKNKSKYGMESEYMQNEYSGMDQQSQQQHGPKNHQPMASKQDKTVYPMSNYDSQVNFDLPEVSTQMKYSVENYASSNFKYPDKSQQQTQNKYQSLVQGQVPPLQHGSITYNNDGKHGQQQSGTKSKANQQQHAIRPPVNWMMTPEIKHNSNIADIILPPIGKELEFCQNNLFAQTPSYNQGTPNQFYNNYDVAAHSFPNLPVLQGEPKRTTDVFYSEEPPFPWSPTKTSVHVDQAQTVKGIDQHIVPSSLPTLVGDLDLGTNIPEKQNFLFGQVPSRLQSDQSKDPNKDKEANVAGRDFHNVLNNQTVQHPGAPSSFLSVSQLVEHEKAEKSSHQQHHLQHPHHHHHHHHAHQHQQQQQQQQQARKHQRKSNASPRGNSKRQMDIRKQNSGNDQLHQRHEEQKTSGHTFTEQGYQQQQQQQQQKYQQNNVHWRNRNCKSNYTAEALIGTNNSVHNTNQDKHPSIKFSANYSQNKFQTSLPTADTVMPLNYFSNTDDGSGYGQMVNQNFNSYTYSSNTNIYPTSNFITSISNTPASYMMPLHDNADYMETNAFLLPNMSASSATTSSTTSTVTTSASNVNTNAKNHQHYGKHQNCDKRTYPTNTKKGKRKGLDGTSMQNLEFPLSGINSPLEDYHHSTTFLTPPPPPHASPLYQNHPQANVYTKAVNSLPPPPSVAGPQGVPTVGTAGFPMNPNMPRGGIVAGNPMTMSHHPSGTSLTNFNLSTIFPEMNDKITGYKPPNGIPPGLSQPPNQSAVYAQRTNYPTNPLCHLPQVSEGSQFRNGVPPPPPPPPPPGVIHYKNV